MLYALKQLLIRGAVAVLFALVSYGLFVLSMIYAGHAMAHWVTDTTARGQAYTNAHTKARQ